MDAHTGTLKKRAGRLSACLLLLLPPLTAVGGLSGCRRVNSDDFDNRTLEKRPPVETEHFQDRGNPFRP